MEEAEDKNRNGQSALIYIHTHIYIYICIYIDTHTHTHIYIYVYIYIDTHTYIHCNLYFQSNPFYLKTEEQMRIVQQEICNVSFSNLCMQPCIFLLRRIFNIKILRWTKQSARNFEIFQFLISVLLIFIALVFWIMSKLKKLINLHRLYSTPFYNLISLFKLLNNGNIAY